MRTTRLIMAGLLIAGGATGCVPKRPPAVASPVVEVRSKSDAWLAIANPTDLSRIQRLSSAWVDGLAEARSAPAGRDAVAVEGDLLRPNAALARPAPTPGSYRCRLVTLGQRGGKGPRIEKYKPFFCYIEVERELFTIVKQTGSQRPAGRLWEDDVSSRLIFLGTLALGNEEEARAYGDDPRRDMAGVFERVGPFRWRLLIPFPQSGGKMDVFELTPVADQPAP